MDAMARQLERSEERMPSRGVDARPLALPGDVDDPAIEKATGGVELPHHIQWSEPKRAYNLSNRVDRGFVYELVLQEGTDQDVRYYIDLDELIKLWGDLYLPHRVRRAWAALVMEKRGIRLPC